MAEDKKATLLLTPKGAISKEDKAQLRVAGYTVIEVKDLSQTKLIEDLPVIGVDIISLAAIETLNHANTPSLTKERFAETLLRKTLAKINSEPPKV